jgi:hypothetical protein
MGKNLKKLALEMVEREVSYILCHRLNFGSTMGEKIKKVRIKIPSIIY